MATMAAIIVECLGLHVYEGRCPRSCYPRCAGPGLVYLELTRALIHLNRATPASLFTHSNQRVVGHFSDCDQRKQ